MKMNQPNQFVSDAKGEKIAVIVSIVEYNELLEDLHDLAIVAERKPEKNLSLESLKRKLA